MRMNETRERTATELKKFFGKEYNLLILAAVIGVLAGTASTVFRWIIDFFAWVFSGEGLLLGLSAGMVAFLMPIMISCVVATYTMRRFTQNSIYVQTLLNRGVNIRHGKAINILSRMFVRDVMTRDVLSITEEMPFKKILETVSYSRHLCYPVVNSEGEMTGIISFSNIRDAAQQEDTVETVLARDLATKDVTALKPNHNLNEALEKFSQLDLQQLPVVQVGDSRKVIGMLRRSDVQAVYNREILVSELKT